ncbi:MAG: PEP-CTERM sorting domain-containing protein [Hyphomicrobiales bacterium]|nr:MAG: PEP-CTERM sorting domain-containing protein [Hyphomicrobiales bacterium]
MKKLFALLAILACSASAHATLYHFSYTGTHSYQSESKTVTGSFEGTANGNVIGNLSNISAFLDGVAFQNNGALFSASIQSYNWASNGAQASFDGKQNNFIFIDGDFLNGGNYSNYFYSVYDGTNNFAHNTTANRQISGLSAWSVTAADVPEPASAALFGISIAALAAARRRKARG